MRLFIIIILISIQVHSNAQIDTTHYPWPNKFFNTSKGINGTFGEFRNTGSSDHFHNAVDIGEPDGNPVYPCLDGTVYYFSNNGYDSYINIKSIINGQKKHMTYYHCVPNPSLAVGQEVKASQTIIGNIYVGAAHVHLIEREFLNPSLNSIGNEINPIRPEGGLTPYVDSYPPVIDESSIRFFRDQSSIQLAQDQLNGKVDIRIKVRERNGATSSSINNGTYILGFRVLSEDGNSVVLQPADDGVKYRFYYLPNDSYAHSAFAEGYATLSDPVYWLTNGNGEKLINENFTIPNNYLDTDFMDEGRYLLEVFSEDTRGNSTSKRFPITVSHLPPELNTVLVSNDSIKISWTEYKSNRLKGYRIYYSDIYSDSIWYLAANESMISNIDNEIVFENPSKFLIPTNSRSLKYYITTIDSLGSESIKSDIYSTIYHNNNAPKLLIVDGFDRYGGNGSWSYPNHEFNTLYSKTIQSALWNFNISSCSNEAIINEKVILTDYDMVIWFLGDESIEENTLVNTEQYALAMYLENGGKLLISGEDIGQDLDTKHKYNEFSDTLFYHQYLKSKLVHDGLDILFEVNGETGTLFEGLNVHFGSNYPVDSPDDIEPINGAQPILNYTYMRDDTTFRKGGVAFKGTFGNSSKLAGLVYLSFPFETIGDEDIRSQLMKQIQLYLGFHIVEVQDNNNVTDHQFELKQNYPNPFNPYTTINYTIQNSDSDINSRRRVKLIIYDVLGRQITTLVNQLQSPGSYNVIFDASNIHGSNQSLASGIFYYQLKSDNYIKTKKMILIK